MTPPLCNGSFELTIKVTAGSLVENKSEFFQIKDAPQECGILLGIETAPKTINVSLGGHNNKSLNSFLDLDLGTSIPAEKALEANSGVDFVYTYSVKEESPVIMTPYYAATQTNLNLYSNWSEPESTQFHTVSTNNYNEAIKRSNAIHELFNNSYNNRHGGRFDIPLGGALVAKTDLDNYFLIRLKSTSESSSGFAEFEISY